jgi:hypothetical protein
MTRKEGDNANCDRTAISETLVVGNEIDKYKWRQNGSIHSRGANNQPKNYRVENHQTHTLLLFSS